MTITEQLRLLSIFHYVVGGLHAFFGCFGLIHFFLGLAMVFDPGFFGPTPRGGPPPVFGWFFVIFGGGFVLFGLALGLLTALSGRFIARRQRRIFSIVVGAINCAMFPFGTVLGVFDLIVLTREEASREYDPPRSPG